MPTLYKTNEADTARYVMGVYHKHPLIAIGVNPSQATLQKPDMTVSKVKKFALQLGFDGYIMLNVYPQRATAPDSLHRKKFAPWAAKNLRTIADVLAGTAPRPVLWAAWGNLIETRPYLGQCLRDIYQLAAQYDPQWIRLGELTRKGHPRHPSRMSYSNASYPFDTLAYF